MMECEGIRGEASSADAVQLQCLREGKVFCKCRQVDQQMLHNKLVCQTIFDTGALRYRAIS